MCMHATFTVSALPPIISPSNSLLACVTAARGRKNEALGSVCASAPNSVFYNFFRLFATLLRYSKCPIYLLEFRSSHRF